MKKYTILAAMMMAVLSFTYAQDTGSSSDSRESYAPAAGDISGAILFGRGNFLNSGLDVPYAPGNNTGWTVYGTAPYNNTIDVNSNSIGNMIGAEVRYFLKDNIALKLSGGAITRNTPARDNVPGYVDSEVPNAGWIPAYASVEADSRVDMNINIGGEYHFSSKYSRLFPYAGLTIPYYYARRSMYDPAILENGDGTPLIIDVGVRSVEIIGFGAQAVAGVDYYLMEGLYFGVEIKPISYVYAYSSKIPGPGLESLKADNHTWSFLSQPFLKVGFRF